MRRDVFVIQQRQSMQPRRQESTMAATRKTWVGFAKTDIYDRKGGTGDAECGLMKVLDGG